MSIENVSQNFINNKSPIEDHSKDQAEIFRFIQDLEFIQLLSNPQYLECKINLINKLGLSANNYFKEQSFLNYLKYLLYFKNPEYAKFVT
jgi:mediator of RNA polymerase II transcription subunit 31